MPPTTSESTAPIPPDARPSFSPRTLLAVGVWACVFAVFVFLGLQP